MRIEGVARYLLSLEHLIVYVFSYTPMNVKRMIWVFVTYNKKFIQLSATDLLALASMKNAAKCDK